MLLSILQSNAKFAVAIDQGNKKLQERKRLIDEQRSQVHALVSRPICMHDPLMLSMYPA